MPIAPQVPGVPTAVTPDASPPIYTSTQGPAPDGLVVADDVLAVHQIALNVQQRILPYVRGALATSKRYALDEAAVPISGLTGAPGDWARSSIVTSAPSWYQAVNRDAALVIPITSLLPPAGKIDYIEMNVTPGPGHGGSLPQYPPTIKLWSSHYYDNAITQYATFTDTTTGPFYETSHDAGGSFTAHTIDPFRKYWITVIGEYGTNSFPDLMLNSVRFRIIP